MKSMTGFGAGEYIGENEQIYVELKTINHRFRDFNMRISRKLSPLEDAVRRKLSETIVRGHVQVNITYKQFGEKAAGIAYDEEVGKAYLSILNTIKEKFPDACAPYSPTEIAKLPNVIVSQEAETDEALWDKLLAALGPAIASLEASRFSEGENLKKDFEERCALIKTLAGKISLLSDAIPAAYYEQLKTNVAEFTSGLIDENRLATELAIYAERVNITEELVRFESHVKSFEALIASSEPVGRKLDFLMQEINREANTMASKSNSAEISALAVEIKSELEKMREQLQNIE